MLEKLPELREKVKKLPMDPGVYLMRDKSGQIIYVGKAKALRNRVSSYFRSLEKHLPKVLRMVEAAEDFDYIVTSSEFEALVLECSLIKRHKPKYNILLKDDKGYHYIKISAGPYPRITAEKKLSHEEGAKILGPYTSSLVVGRTVDEVNRAFLLPTCGRKFPEDCGKGRPCLNYHIKQCIGVCTGRIRQKDYAEIIEDALDFIGGGNQNALAALEQRMQEAAGRMEYEKAARYRDRMTALTRIAQHQNVVFAKVPDQDAVAIAQNGRESSAAVLKFREQRLIDKQDFALGEIADLSGARRDFLLSYYSSHPDVPRQISLDGKCADKELVARYLSEQQGRKVALHIPERGEQLRVMEMAKANAAQSLSHTVERTGRELAALDEFARLLGLPHPPDYIEAYDISNMGEETAVGGMVVFENGRPLKSAYRKFNIKTISGADDYGSMREMISRRLERYLTEQHTGEGFGKLPDLILLDGGKGHVSAIRPLLEQKGLAIPVYGMVKDDKHRTRAIASDGGEIAINSSRAAFSLVTKIQDETHRFAISHMKQRHTKKAFASRLTQVEGIGEKRAGSLLRHFKTIKAMTEATPEQLAQAPGMNKASAQALYQYLHQG